MTPIRKKPRLPPNPNQKRPQKRSTAPLSDHLARSLRNARRSFFKSLPADKSPDLNLIIDALLSICLQCILKSEQLPKLTEVISLIKLKLRLISESPSSAESQFWKMIDDVRREELGRAPPKKS